MKSFILNSLLIITTLFLFGCTDENNSTPASTDTEATNSQTMTKFEYTTVEQLNNGILNQVDSLDHYGFANAYINFDFPIYEPTSALRSLPFGGRSGNYLLESEQLQTIINTTGYTTSSPPPNDVDIISYYFISGFYDTKDPLYQKILNLFKEVTYFQDEEYQSIHWLTSDGLYHRIFIEIGHEHTKEELTRMIEDSIEEYEESLLEKMIPNYIVLAAVDKYYENNGIHIGLHYYGDSYWSSGTFLFSDDTRLDDALKTTEEIFAIISDLYKTSLVYNEQTWKESNFEINVKYNSADVPIATGVKNSNGEFEWTNLIAD